MRFVFVMLFRFQLISSGAQLGRSGICVAFGVVFFYFGSVVGPCVYLVKEICPRGNNKVIIYFLIS